MKRCRRSFSSRRWSLQKLVADLVRQLIAPTERESVTTRVPVEKIKGSDTSIHDDFPVVFIVARRILYSEAGCRTRSKPTIHVVRQIRHAFNLRECSSVSEKQKTVSNDDVEKFLMILNHRHFSNRNTAVT